MKGLPIKYIQILCTLAVITFIGSPFFKIPGEPLENGYIPNDRLTGFDFTFEYLVAYFTNTSVTTRTDLVIIAFTVVIIVLMQFIAGLIKRDKLIISTAAVLFFITVAGLVYLNAANLPVELRWGYYVFMVIQFAIAVFTPMSPVEPKKWANKS